MAKVVVAWTTPFVAKSVPLKVPIPRVVVVAFVATRLVEKKVVEVALVLVLFTMSRLVMVEEAELTRSDARKWARGRLGSK